MPAPFNDIIFSFPPAKGQPPERNALHAANFICDLYRQAMQGYKPRACTRIALVANESKVEHEPRKVGQLVATKIYFDQRVYDSLSQLPQYKYLLSIIHEQLMQLSARYEWDKLVFERAYAQVLDDEFNYRVNHSPILSKNRMMAGFISIEKTERLSAVFANINKGSMFFRAKLLEKKNDFAQDCVHVLARHAQWFDNDRFGLRYDKAALAVWYSLRSREVTLNLDDMPAKQFNFTKHFWLQTSHEG